MIKIYLLLTLAAGILSSCTSVYPCPDNTPSVMLPSTQKRAIRLADITFPKGQYSPQFQSVEGIYYKSDKKIYIGGAANFGVNRPNAGGFFVPFPSNKDQRQAFWQDMEESGGGLVYKAASSSTRLVKFEPPLEYQVIK